MLASNESCCRVLIPPKVPPQTPVENCCAPPKSQRFLTAVETICKVALSIFAAYVSPLYFSVSALAGILAGMGYAIYKICSKDPILQGDARPSCAQGFFDYLSGIRCPRLASAVITAVFIAGHMYHSPFYVAFCGVPIGFFVGSQITIKGWNLGSKVFKKIEAPPQRRSCCGH